MQAILYPAHMLILWQAPLTVAIVYEHCYLLLNLLQEQPSQQASAREITIRDTRQVAIIQMYLLLRMVVIVQEYYN